MTLAEKLRKLVDEQGVDLKQVATRASMSYHTVRSYSQGRADKFPSVRNGIALARALNVSIEWLYDDSKGWPPVPYHLPPPFRISPWPPALSWEELQLAIKLYVGMRFQVMMGIADKQLQSTEDGSTLLRDPTAFLLKMSERAKELIEAAENEPSPPETP